MSESKHPTEGHEGHALYGVTDACPSCSKRVKDMAAEHDGKLLHVMEIFLVCYRCGTLFVPQSRIKHVFAAATQAAEKRIITPTSPEAQQLIQQVPR